MATRGPMLEKSKKFAIQIVRLSQYLIGEKKEFVLSRQILRSGTSIGANLNEARGAQSPADFLSKQTIALKEAYETEYWIDLLAETGYLSTPASQTLLNELSEILSMLTQSIKTMRIKIYGDQSIVNDASVPYDFDFMN